MSDRRFPVIVYAMYTQDAFGRYQGKDCQGSNGDLVNMCQMELLLIGKGPFKILFGDITYVVKCANCKIVDM